MQKIILTFLSCLVMTFSVTAKECADSCFYAISSIRFHLDNLTDYYTEQNQEDKIGFSSEEIENLWVQAEKSNLSEEVALAKKYYYQALSEEEMGEFNRNIYKSQEILEDIWVELNQEYFDEKKSWAEVDWWTDELEFDPVMKKDVSNDLFKEIKPYLLPSSHPMKGALDRIFPTNNHVLRNLDTFTNAGFSLMYKQPLSHIVVARHSFLNGYLVKAYLDSDGKTKNTDPGWKWLVRRCQGAENIRKLIRRKNIQFFTVPDKWIYVTDSRAYNQGKQSIVLLVTDMRLVSKEESREAWKNLVTKKHLEELYCIFSHGYSSCWLVENIPYTKDGTFSCIDTEYPKRTLEYERARRYLNEEMQQYWDLLIKTGGKPTDPI